MLTITRAHEMMNRRREEDTTYAYTLMAKRTVSFIHLLQLENGNAADRLRYFSPAKTYDHVIHMVYVRYRQQKAVDLMMDIFSRLLAEPITPAMRCLGISAKNILTFEKLQPLLEKVLIKYILLKYLHPEYLQVRTPNQFISAKYINGSTNLKFLGRIPDETFGPMHVLCYSCPDDEGDLAI